MTARRWPVGAVVIALAVVPGASANADAPDEQVTEPPLTAEVLPVPPPPAPGIDPAPPAPTGLIPPLSTIGGLLGQTGIEPAGPLGLPDLATYGNALVLGQNLVPSVPGTAEQAVTPSLEVFTDEYLVPLNLVPAAPGEGSPAPGIGPNADIPGAGRIAMLRRLHEMYQAGNLTGALLGQLPKDEFGQPMLPEADPPPG
jgi:hypothetical protein